MQRKIKIIVVDDHSLFRRGLVALLDQNPILQVVAQAADANQGQTLVGQYQPDVVLLDNQMPGVTGIEALPALREIAPNTKFLILTVSEDEAHLGRALCAGASGYILKTIDADKLIEAIESVLAGVAVISPELTSKLIAALQSTGEGHADWVGSQPDSRSPNLQSRALASLTPLSSAEKLTQRESQVLQQIAAGLSNKAIAKELGIADTTVKIHVQNILRKLGLSSRVQAAIFATRHF